MDIRERSDLQLVRISNGADELTQMIDSWTKASTLGSESIQMANELLRGSLELRESLQMLSRLQEASRRMSKRRIIRQREREQEEEENLFMGMSSVDCTTNSVEELKQVVRDRLCKQNLCSNTGLKFSGRKINFGSPAKKARAPSLVAKLMGLEQVPTGSKDRRKLRQEEEMKDQPEQKSVNLAHYDQVLPIVILKSVNLAPWKREENNLASEKMSERDKTTLAELLLEEKTLAVKRNLKYNTEPMKNLRIGVDPCQKQQEKEVNMENKRIVDRKNSIIQGKRFVELKQERAIGAAPVNTTSAESTKSENEETYKSLKENRLTNSMALKSNCEENNSREKPVRKFISETKIDDPNFKDGKLRICGTETGAISGSNGMLITDGLLTQENKETIIFVNKDEIKKDHKIVCEVMPKTHQARRNMIEQSIMPPNNESTTNPAAKSQHLFKHQLSYSKSFHEFAHNFFGIDAGGIPMYSQINSEDTEVGGEQLLLDCAKELMALRSHEGKISISQMLQPHQRKRSSFLSFNHLLEEISKGIEELATYSENGEGTSTKNSLYIILEKDLNANWDIGRNNWGFLEEADQVAAEVEKQIISKLIMEVSMDLVDLE